MNITIVALGKFKNARRLRFDKACKDVRGTWILSHYWYRVVKVRPIFYYFEMDLMLEKQ